MSRHDWGFSEFFEAGGFGPKVRSFCEPGRRPGGSRRRQQMFESGEVKFLILRLLKEKPRHGYEIIKALEQKLGGWYTPSAGTVYPTLQLLEDQGYVRIVETEGKKVYHVTAEGERFLEENRGVLEEILDRVRDAVRGVAGGTLGDLNQVFTRIAGLAYPHAWRSGPGDARTQNVVDILRKAAEEIEAALKT